MLAPPKTIISRTGQSSTHPLLERVRVNSYTVPGSKYRATGVILPHSLLLTDKANSMPTLLFYTHVIMITTFFYKIEVLSKFRVETF